MFHRHGGIDEVLSVVFVAGRDVAGNGKIRQGTERNVVGATDAILVHAAAPHRHATSLAKVVDLARLQQTAYTAGFDVDDPTAPEIKCFTGILC